MRTAVDTTVVGIAVGTAVPCISREGTGFHHFLEVFRPGNFVVSPYPFSMEGFFPGDETLSFPPFFFFCMSVFRLSLQSSTLNAEVPGSSSTFWDIFIPGYFFQYGCTWCSSTYNTTAAVAGTSVSTCVQQFFPGMEHYDPPWGYFVVSPGIFFSTYVQQYVHIILQR